MFNIFGKKKKEEPKNVENQENVKTDLNATQVNVRRLIYE
jgi:hypothetical protein